MARTEKVYPEWVQKQRIKGTTVKKKGDAYYLYKRTSKRVPGKKYPQPVDTYIGVITPEGIIKSEKRKISLTDAVVKEFGFSRAVELLCPQSWKDPLGKNWQTVLDTIILKESGESYIGKERGMPKEFPPHTQYGAQKSSLARRIYKECDVEMKELKALSTIYLIYLDGNRILSMISEEQQELLDRTGIRLEVD